MAQKLADSTGENGSGENIPGKDVTRKGIISKENADKKSQSLNEEFLAIDSDSVDFDGEEEAPPPRTLQKDPFIRRKIEDLLERRRLREELGIYDDEAWEGL
ncbi:MAG TPA: hypothetical protein VLC91_05105 [Spongiibacteraceae bacterium]|nr:hypothetical protein [Spongiibacteraceae bacterium]